MNSAELARRRDAAAAIAAEAAQLAARLRAEGRGVAGLKSAQDFITEADGATETFLRERLGKLFPGEDVLGEEMGGSVASAGPLWVLDPIDGTANFARGQHRWCVSVGMVLANRAVVGAIARDSPAEIFAAAEGCGATLNGAPIAAAATTDITRAIVELGWSPRRPVAEYAGLVERAMRAGVGTRCTGSGALALVDVACGRLDGYLELHINSWDAAAATAIAREAGCWMNPFDSGAWISAGNPICFAAPALGPALAEMLRG